SSLSFYTTRHPPSSPLFPYTTLFRSGLGSRRTGPTAMNDQLLLAVAEGLKLPLLQVSRLAEAGRLQAAADVLQDIQTTTDVALRSEEHTSELQSRSDLVCRLLLEKKK